MKLFFIYLMLLIFSFGCNSSDKSHAAEKESTDTKSESPAVVTDLSPDEIRLHNALLAAPEEKREGCTVYGYSADKELIILREGTNEMICIADDPDVPGFSVACYHKDLEPFMKRGRELRKQGFKDQALIDEREKEVEAGKLKMPPGPTSLFVYSAKAEDYNESTGEIKNGYLRYVVYIPYATSASTGLPENPSAKGMPWIMNPGTARAHIMINP